MMRRSSRGSALDRLCLLYLSGALRYLQLCLDFFMLLFSVYLIFMTFLTLFAFLLFCFEAISSCKTLSLVKKSAVQINFIAVIK